jgi:hypothetical protein
MSNLFDEIRQATVVQTTGPGAMTVLQRGLSVMIPGLDVWYVGPQGKQDIPEECIFTDKNLSEALRVEYFVQPPAVGLAEERHSEYLNVFVFPRWVVCYGKGCKSLVGISESETKRPYCLKCSETSKKRNETVQVNFVVGCEAGHLDEFPWSQWVHKSLDAICSNPHLTLASKGSGDLKGQSVACLCGAKRNLAGTSDATEMRLDGDQSRASTFLSRNLDEQGREFLCSGSQPWLRQSSSEGCGLPVRMILRNSNNIYFGAIESSILVPSVVGEHAELAELIQRDPKIGIFQSKLVKHKYNYEKVADMILETLQEQRYEGHSVENIAAALEAVEPRPTLQSLEAIEDNHEEFYERGHEFKALLEHCESGDLVVRMTDFVPGSIEGIQRINAIPRLKETRALKGFSRIKPLPVDTTTGRAQFRRRGKGPGTNWLPAVRYVGEGIFVSFDIDFLEKWENQPSLVARIKPIEERLILNGLAKPNRPITPRLVFLHTLAHVLIQELVIECGYTAASLKERIYSSESYAGILIYTASPDSDGTMGGLVEMASNEIFGRVLDAALEGASWCSNDPVCMELGEHGQGSFGSNLAACHSCCLLPETACEMFNSGLDRAVLVGNALRPDEFDSFFKAN